MHTKNATLQRNTEPALHPQKAYLDSRYKEEDFPVTNQLVKEVLSLPMHTELDDEQIKFITDSVLEFLK